MNYIKNRTLRQSIVAWIALVFIYSVAGLSGVALGDDVKAEVKPQVELKVHAPRQATQNSAVTIGIDYTVLNDMEPGKAVVTYHNVDTGEEFTKTVELPLTKGKHKAQAVWGADETLPNGMYVIKVVVNDAAGKELAQFATSPDNVRSMMVHGGALTRMVNAEQTIKEVGDLTTWRDELEKLVKAADAAGADTTRQKILIVVIDQMKFWSREVIPQKDYEILDINHKYLKKEYEKAKAQLEAMAKDPNAFPKEAPIPRPKERFTIRDGGFYAGDQQMFLSGPCFFDFTAKYIPVAAELGFNVIQVSFGPDRVFPKSLDEVAVPHVGSQTLPELLDECEKLGIKVDLGLTSHFMPKWVYEKYPDARNKFVLYGMMPYDIEHPEVLKVIQKFYDTVMPTIANHPALNSIWIANEPEYMNPNERNIAIFRPWLEAKYKTIDNLNKAWGTELKSFDEIVAGGRKGHPVPDAVSTGGAMLDWWKYSTERVMRHFKWQKDLIHKYDPTLPVSAKLYNGTFNPQFKPMSRVDEESAFDMFGSYMGMDGGSFPFSKPYKDFLRSLEPTQPMANLEYKFGGILTKLFFWQETMQGVTDNNWWCWHPKRAFSAVPKDAQSMHQAALAKLDIQRLLPKISLFHKLPGAPMVFLYPDPVAGRYWEYFGFNDPTNRAVTLMGFNCDYASEKRVGMGRLDQYQVLIMPAADFIRDETYAKVKAFIEGGKTAIVLGAIPEHDEYGHPRDASFFRPQGESKEIAFGDYKAVKFTAGKGTIYHLPTVPRSADGKNHLTADSAKLITDVLELALKETLPQQPVVIRNAEGKPFIENRTVASTNAAGEKTYLTYVVNDWLDSDQVIEPKLNFKAKSCRDLITGVTLDPKRISVPSGDVMLLEFVVE